jgi:CRISPR-associated endonuclease/helicase Cas3
MLDARMLFSALVDADFIATEGHFNGAVAQPYIPREEGPALDIDNALAALGRYVAEVRKRHADDPISPLREQLYSAAVTAAMDSPGAFTLTAPTGCGKTLAMLAFALHHAKQHRLRRIILVMPFLNIIDQAAKIYRAIFSEKGGFPENTVVEHHSLAGRRGGSAEGDDNGRNYPARLLSENWDAPIILTTTVQFFESLMACKTSPCRKLHRIAGSVVLFDEAQSLPPRLAAGSLATVSRLADSSGPYRTSIVLATATQPAFDLLDRRIRERSLSPGWKPREIVEENAALFQGVSSRVAATWRHETPIDLDGLALEIARLRRVLCIVNLKRHAVRLATKLRELGAQGLLHLSTNLCPAHRDKVLRRIDARMKRGEPICLIATQCVEAGVDLDFPVVYRALAPLEAIAQAAGRCNRHGIGATGRLIVFKPLDSGRLYPPGYGAAVQATESFLKIVARTRDGSAVDIINSPALLRRYYEHLYGLTGRAGVARCHPRGRFCRGGAALSVDRKRHDQRPGALRS